jgi:glycine/D-amino acid oxidase-like deaminating enzyme
MVAAPILLSGCTEKDTANPTEARLELPAAKSFDFIVIGAGSIGCNTAWHLGKRGQKVLVIDAQPTPASQSTNGAAGFVASWSLIHQGAWKKTEWEMQRYGIEFYSGLAKRSSSDIGFRQSGIAYIYATPAGWKRVQPKIKQARNLGTKLEVLTAERAKELTPFLEFPKLAGVIYDPDAIRVRAGDAIRALAEELRADGVNFSFDSTITEFIRDGDSIVGVRTKVGDLRAGKVIVAAGAWTRPLLAKLGVDCPAVAFNETRYTTAPLDGVPPGMPLLIFSDQRGHYIREDRGGLLIGGGDPRPLPPDRIVNVNDPPWCDKLPHDQATRVREYIRDITPLMPVLAEAEVGEIRSGVPSHTKDSLFLAGPVPGMQGLFAMSGCQEAGVTHGPALGRILAEQAIDGKTAWDTARFRWGRTTA